MTDVPRIAWMLRKFYTKSGDIYGIPWDQEAALDTVSKTVLTGVCIVGEHSCAGALIFDFPYNKSAKIASVLFWRFTKGREASILQELAKTCKAMGATHINPSSLWPANTTGRLYRDMGLREIETQWLGEIACLCEGRE